MHQAQIPWTYGYKDSFLAKAELETLNPSGYLSPPVSAPLLGQWLLRPSEALGAVGWEGLLRVLCIPGLLSGGSSGCTHQLTTEEWRFGNALDPPY